jgi:hypothetical protein
MKSGKMRFKTIAKEWHLATTTENKNPRATDPGKVPIYKITRRTKRNLMTNENYTQTQLFNETKKVQALKEIFEEQDSVLETTMRDINWALKDLKWALRALDEAREKLQSHAMCKYN